MSACLARNAASASTGRLATISGWTCASSAKEGAPCSTLRTLSRRGWLPCQTSSCGCGSGGSPVAPRVAASRASWSAFGISGARVSRAASGSSSTLGEPLAKYSSALSALVSGPSGAASSFAAAVVQSLARIAARIPR